MLVRTAARVMLALVLVLKGGAGASAEGLASASAAFPSPTVIAGLTPAPRVGSAFRNLDPAYHRASMATRFLYLLFEGSWLAGSRVAPLALAAYPPSLAARRSEPADRDVDRSLHGAGRARRGRLPDRSDLGEPIGTVRRSDRRAPLYATRCRFRRAAPDRFRPDLPRSLRSSRRADRPASRPEVRSPSSSCRWGSRPGWRIGRSGTSSS